MRDETRLMYYGVNEHLYIVAHSEARGVLERLLRVYVLTAGEMF